MILTKSHALVLNEILKEANRSKVEKRGQSFTKPLNSNVKERTVCVSFKDSTKILPKLKIKTSSLGSSKKREQCTLNFLKTDGFNPRIRAETTLKKM